MAHSVLICLPASMAVDPVWYQRQVPGPGPRREHAMVYDSRRARVVLFGGTNVGYTGGLLGDTWEWDGRTWVRVAEVGPPARAFHTMAFDAHRGITVLFGGMAVSDGLLTFMRDTWEWDGTDWTQRTVSTSPSGRTHAAMAFDGGRRVCVLFGGYRGRNSGNSRETWEWNGASWGLGASGGPDARSQHAVAYDPGGGATLLFGGITGSIVGDTWTWSGAGWTNLAPAFAPSPRREHAMSYDAKRRSVVLYGGELPYGSYSGETWECVESGWGLLPTSAGERYGHAIAHDRERGVTVLFGGNVAGVGIAGDTWELGCPNGDMNCDGGVDLGDYVELQTCLRGPGTGLPSGCMEGDTELDADIDLRDVAVFQRVFRSD